MIAEVVPKPNRESRNMIIVLFLVFCVGFIFGSTAAKPVEIKYGDVVQKD